MNARWDEAAERVAELRRAFDQSFAEPPRSGVAAFVDLLSVTFGPTLYAVRLSEIAGLCADITITPLPTSIADLIGITAFQGGILPAYDLRLMLGYPADTPPRWLAIAAGASVGLAFDSFAGHVRVGPEAIVPQSGGDRAARHVREVVQLDGRVRPIVSVPSVLEAIATRVREAAVEKE